MRIAHVRRDRAAKRLPEEHDAAAVDVRPREEPRERRVRILLQPRLARRPCGRAVAPVVDRLEGETAGGRS